MKSATQDNHAQRQQPDRYWQAVTAKDRSWDGRFVYAVRSTGVYCKPSCPARRPHRRQVVFFSIPEAAEREGYRPCRRCKPQRADGADRDTQAVRTLCHKIAATNDGRINVDSLADQAKISPRRLRSLFKQMLGVTPTQYAQACRRQKMKDLLHNGRKVTRALYEAGYGSASRLYENITDKMGMTPAAYRRGGKGMTIRYAVSDSPLGKILVAVTDKGICSVRLGDSCRTLESGLRQEFAAATIRRDEQHLRAIVATILQHLDGRHPDLDLPLDIRATAFQQRVWQELRRIPWGQTRSYGDIAATLGQPTAVRAVARACASNPVALVVPCHRVIGSNGQLTGYRWGLKRKKELLEHEQHGSGQS